MTTEIKIGQKIRILQDNLWTKAKAGTIATVTGVKTGLFSGKTIFETKFGKWWGFRRRAIFYVEEEGKEWELEAHA